MKLYWLFLFYRKDRGTIFSEYDLLPSDIWFMFEQEAMKYKFDVPIPAPSTTRKSTAAATLTSHCFEDAIFGSEDAAQDFSIGNKITRYLNKKLEIRDTKVLEFRKRRVDIYPGLARMAMNFLAIPATSCPSGGGGV